MIQTKRYIAVITAVATAINLFGAEGVCVTDIPEVRAAELPEERVAEIPEEKAPEMLEEVTVTGNSAVQRIAEKRIGAEHLELAKLTALPSFGGENDVIKALALLPGVRSEGDGGGGFEVRGGNASQNLVLLDGITLYNPAHVMGIFSTFNDNAL